MRNVVRDTIGVRKLGDLPDDFLLNDRHVDIRLRIQEFPVLGAVRIVDGDTGALLSWPSKIKRPDVDAALELDFLEQERNLVLVASEGLGKTMIARNVIHNAILDGRSALFISAAELLLDLGAQESARGLDRRLKYYARIGLLAIDEIGYLSYDIRNADLLFQLVSMRYEKKPLVLTTNLHFSEWPKIFPGAACTTALIDRVVHHADIISIEGKSYRLRDATENKKKT